MRALPILRAGFAMGSAQRCGQLRRPALGTPLFNASRLRVYDQTIYTWRLADVNLSGSQVMLQFGLACAKRRNAMAHQTASITPKGQVPARKP